jgi:hypothetical protein
MSLSAGNLSELRGETYDLRMILGINENVLHTQVMEINSELVGLSARALQEYDESLHHALPPIHFFSHALLPLLQMSDQEGTPLVASIVTIHSIARSIPLLFTLLDVPFIAIITTITRNGL